MIHMDYEVKFELIPIVINYVMTMWTMAKMVLFTKILIIADDLSKYGNLVLLRVLISFAPLYPWE